VCGIEECTKRIYPFKPCQPRVWYTTFAIAVRHIQWRHLSGVIPKPGAFISGARDLALTLSAPRKILRFRLKNGCAQDDAAV